ncbi:MAG: RhuM family protein, partial [Spirochaetota bacterium]
RKAPSGKVLKSDIKIAKNYLSKEELKEMNHIVNMYLDYAELQASRGRLMKMRDWEEKLNAFLQFNDYEVLQNKGRISREIAQALAEQEYKEFRITQDKNYISDFDKIIKDLKKPGK